MIARFEGRALPSAAELGARLAGPPADLGWLVRAAVVDASFADMVIAECARSLEHPEARHRGAAVQAGHALLARRLTGPLAALVAAADPRYVGVADPTQPGRTLAMSALRFLMEVPVPGHAAAEAALRAALGVAELRPLAWEGLGATDPDAVLPWLGALLLEIPALAEAVATRFALVHTARCLEAARVVASLPEATRRAFAAALSKHLLRINAVKQWVACREAIFGG